MDVNFFQGVTNNVAWNYGAPTFRQLKLAVERYYWNRKEGYTSIVPMETVAWTLVNREFKDVQLLKYLQYDEQTIIQINN